MPALGRREFLKIGLGGLAVIAVGSQAEKVADLLGGARADASVRILHLHVQEALVEFYDLTPVYMWTFSDTEVPKFPGPAIYGLEGDTIEVVVHNHLDEDHAFAIVGTSINSGPVAPGQSKTVSFVLPPAGTYIYHDPLRAPVNRVLGLHGVLVSLAPSGNNPYTSPTTAVSRLFNDLGTTAHFPGEAWTLARTRLWQMHNTDPRWNSIAQSGQIVDPAKMIREFKSRYFTVSGHSGHFASHDPDIFLSGRVGQPMLVRIVNTGMVTHSLHIHGNHAYVISLNQKVQESVHLIDTFTLSPLDRMDWIVPFIRPPDIAGPKNAPLREVVAEELAFVDKYGLPQSPLSYPMHCHVEPSQTSGGGNYPGGMVTKFVFTGDLDGVDFPVPQFKALTACRIPSNTASPRTAKRS